MEIFNVEKNLLGNRDEINLMRVCEQTFDRSNDIYFIDFRRKKIIQTFVFFSFEI